ncbi:unnamed protein product, partial [Meganyctiphanes norvegica]
MRARLVIFLLIIVIYSSECAKKIKVDMKKSRAYGPGLQPDKIVFPARYFFIELYDTKGNRINKSVGSSITVQVEGETTSGTYCRVWTQILDRYDGSYIVRYRTYQTCRKTSIHILYNSKHLGDSPYTFSGSITGITCHDHPNIGGGGRELSIHKGEFSIVQGRIGNMCHESVAFNNVLRALTLRFGHSQNKPVCSHFGTTNEIFRKCYGQHVGFNMFMDNILHSMARKMILPDIEFIVNLGDWPLVDPKVTPLLPIFSWCGSTDTADIIMPTYDMTEATLEMMGRIASSLMSIVKNIQNAWRASIYAGYAHTVAPAKEKIQLLRTQRYKKKKKISSAGLRQFFLFFIMVRKYEHKEYITFMKHFEYKHRVS